MKIKLDDNYYIKDSYGSSVSLMQGTGEETVELDSKGVERKVVDGKFVGDFKDVPQALVKYIKIKAHATDEEFDLKSYAAHFRKCTDDLLKILD